MLKISTIISVFPVGRQGEVHRKEEKESQPSLTAASFG